MSTHFSGGGLCGAVRYACASEPVSAGHCHCVDCRKSSGIGHCSHLVARKGDFEISGTLTQFDKAADSGNMVSRFFYPACGAAVYSLNSAMPEMVFPRASSLDDPENFQAQLIVYASRAPSWDHMDPQLPRFSEMPPQADMPVG